MSIIPNKLKALAPYQPNDGEFDIRLDANESFIPLSAEILEKLSEITKKIEYNRYPDPLATKVTKAFADYFSLNPENCAAGNGSDELISIIINCFTEKGSKVLCLTPDFSMYSFYSYLAELETIDLSKDENFDITVDKIISLVNEKKPSVLIFSNPCNPTGRMMSVNDIKKITSSCDCLFVLDEAYMDFSNDSFLNCIEEFDNVIILKTCSKAFGLAALRLGFAISSKEIAGLLKAAKSPYNVNTVTQCFGEAVLSEKEFLKACTAKIVQNKRQLFRELTELSNIYPQIIKVCDTKTNFVVIKTKYAKELFEGLKIDKIAVRCFEGFLRITTGNEYENNMLIKSLVKSLTQLKGWS